MLDNIIQIKSDLFCLRQNTNTQDPKQDYSLNQDTNGDKSMCPQITSNLMSTQSQAKLRVKLNQITTHGATEVAAYSYVHCALPSASLTL